ncbi:sialate O-acetylesterase [Flammeovirga sp. OC4]|uniref:sialate O-acetylesterase n=1 Tax=Flammeovirga sp. OC4 TaxID=1382345 RepID=UPI0005C760F3|nr:sialate O-acetylesterase [Flammeovirga sp. OC4]
MKSNFYKASSLFVLASLVSLSVVAQTLKLADIFTNDMVIQADKEIKVWGKAEPNTPIKVSLGNKSTSVKSDQEGKWKAILPKMKYGGPHTLEVNGKEKRSFTNVMVGEVWFCAGQSNMRWFVRDAKNPKEEIAAANHSNIRFFTVPLSGSEFPQEHFTQKTKWEVCTPKSVAQKTAVGYYFGRELQEKLKGVAIGLIDISYGGASISTFMDAETVKNSKSIQGIKKRNKNFLAAYERQMDEWRKDTSKRPPHYPEQYLGSFCYNDMYHPIIPFSVRGTIWYQGETNEGEPDPYVIWFGEYIEMMRDHFENEEMPFYYVQLAGFAGTKGSEMKYPSWATFRLAQAKCLKYENTGMATAYDLGEPNEIHPKNKQEVGRRLSLLALRDTYGKKVIAQGPTYKSYKVNGDKVVLEFSNVAKRLVSTTATSSVKGFMYEITPGTYEAVEAKIIGKNKVELPLKAATLYYSYENYAAIDLYNSERLPVYPFKVAIKPSL